MTFDEMSYQPLGDKKNSAFFDEYRQKIYERRNSSGLSELLGGMRAIVVQVEHADAVPYLCELYLMGPYRLTAAFQSTTHRVFMLASQPEFPRLIVMEPLTVQYLSLIHI